MPAVLGFSDEWLVIEAVPKGQASPAAAERFGRELAALHQAGADAFGAPPPGGPVDVWIGLAPMRNVAGSRWPEWYAEHRIRPYLRTAVDRGVLHDPAPVEAVCARIGELAGPDEEPARLHGDLWNGNVLWDGNSAWLIDPAAHGGHRETDLAMLHLFGCRTSTGSSPPTARPSRSPTGGGTALPCTSSFRCSSTPSCSAAGTGARPSPLLGL